MIKKKIAIQIQQKALNAVKELHSILQAVESDCSEPDCESIKGGVGLSLGTIQMELLEVINTQYPELDDLYE